MAHVDDDAPQPKPVLLGMPGRILFGLYLMLAAAVLLTLLVVLWPAHGVAADGKEFWATEVKIAGANVVVCELSYEVRLMLIAAVVGALGGYVHVATSFSTYVGNQTLGASWVWWYILRLPIGAVLALLFYFVSRGGLISAGASGEVLSPFGIAAGAGLVGLFSKQATDKMKELADNLFRTAPGQGDAERKDKLEQNSPLPQVRAVDPTAIKVNAVVRTVKVSGAGFVDASVVQVNGANRKPTAVAPTLIAFDLSAADVAQAGVLKVGVFNPPPQGGASNTVEIPVAV